MRLYHFLNAERHVGTRKMPTAEQGEAPATGPGVCMQLEGEDHDDGEEIADRAETG